MSCSFTDLIDLATAQGGGGSGGTVANVGLVVPLYNDPGGSSPDEWTQLLTLKATYPSLPIIAIANPSNGVGDGIGESGTRGILSIYLSTTNGIPALQAAGITVLGYVGTNYGLNTPAAESNNPAVGPIPLSAVEQQISDWQTWYGVDGIFLDEMDNSNGYGSQTYYADATAYAHGLGLTPVWGNPGTSTIASYVGTVDAMVCYEDNGQGGTSSPADATLPTAATIRSNSIGTGGNRSQWAIIVLNIASAPSVAYITSISTYISWIYVTQLNALGSNNPYSALPSYLTTEAANIISGGGTTTTGGGGSPTAVNMGYFFLMNVYPGPVWTDFINAHSNFTSVPMAIVANVASGPGTLGSPDPSYQLYITQMQNAGIKVLGAVFTDYGISTGTVSIAAAEAQINTWFANYGVDGIFLQQMDTTNSSTNAAYYSTLTAYVHAQKQGAVCWGFSAVATHAVYLNTVDVIIPYVGSGSAGLPASSAIAAVTTAVGGTATQWGAMIYDLATAAPATFFESIETYVSWICVTDETDTNFDEEPSYLTTEIAALSTVNQVTLSAVTVSIYSSVARTGYPVLTTGFTITASFVLESGTSVALSDFIIKDLDTNTILYSQTAPVLNLTYGLGSGRTTPTPADPGPLTTSDISDHLILFQVTCTPVGPVSINARTSLISP